MGILSNIKTWLWAGVVAAFGILTAMLKWSEHKRSQAEVAKERAEREVQSQKALKNVQKDVQKAQQESREKAAQYETPKTTERPSGDFGDPRLRNDDD